MSFTFVYMGLVARNPVIGVSDQVMLEISCSASENTKNSGISIVGSIDINTSNKRATKALIRLCGCAGRYASLLLANPQRQVLAS